MSGDHNMNQSTESLIKHSHDFTKAQVAELEMLRAENARLGKQVRLGFKMLIETPVITDEEIEQGYTALEHMRRALSKELQRKAVVEKQRDELLEILDAIRFALEPYDDIKPRDWKSDRFNLRDAHKAACEALAKAKGERL